MSTSEWISLFTAFGAIVAASAAVLAIRAQSKAQRVDRIVALHGDLTSGDVGAARDRFTTLMWRARNERRGPNRCYQPSYKELLLESEGGTGELARYDASISDHLMTPLRDLYKVLWCFERINAALSHRVVDKKLTQELVGFHAIWWDELCVDVPSGASGTRYRASLDSLARWARRSESAAL